MSKATPSVPDRINAWCHAEPHDLVECSTDLLVDAEEELRRQDARIAELEVEAAGVHAELESMTTRCQELVAEADAERDEALRLVAAAQAERDAAEKTVGHRDTDIAHACASLREARAEVERLRAEIEDSISLEAHETCCEEHARQVASCNMDHHAEAALLRLALEDIAGGLAEAISLSPQAISRLHLIATAALESTD